MQYGSKKFYSRKLKLQNDGNQIQPKCTLELGLCEVFSKLMKVVKYKNGILNASDIPNLLQKPCVTTLLTENEKSFLQRVYLGWKSGFFPNHFMIESYVQSKQLQAKQEGSDASSSPSKTYNEGNTAQTEYSENTNSLLSNNPNLLQKPDALECTLRRVQTDELPLFKKSSKGIVS